MKTTIARILIICFILTTSFRLLGQEYNVKDYGAKGDSHSDDYFAIKKVVDIVNQKKTGTIYFPPGEYYIGQYHNGKDKIQDLVFKNCNGLKIYGKQAKISLNGNFHRTPNRRIGKFSFSNIQAIIPIEVDSCTNVTIQDLEINGNVNQMIRDSGVVEAGGHLVLISESSNISLSNLMLHHAQTDGLVLKGNSNPSSDITAVNVISSNNARQG